MIAILDYGAGNLRSVQNTLGEIGADYTLVRNAEGLQSASKILLPGVGHFGQMMRALDALNVRNALKERIAAGTPFLGICLGLHALFERSEEAPELEGLSIFPGSVVRFAAAARVPHMGWNNLAAKNSLVCLGDFPPNRTSTSRTATTCPRSRLRRRHALTPFLTRRSWNPATCSAFSFTPKSRGPTGLQIVKNFIEI